jgi:hypothetical protein
VSQVSIGTDNTLANLKEEFQLPPMIYSGRALNLELGQSEKTFGEFNKFSAPKPA